MLKIGLTGGIACGKSLLSSYLKEFGAEVIDADEIVHELVPLEERRRLAKIVFANPKARHELEARLHPIVRERIDEFFAKPGDGIRIAAVPLLFECNWQGGYDIIVCVISDEAVQVERMMTTRGYSRDEALSRLSAQMPVREKALKSHLVVRNNGSPAELREEARRLYDILLEKSYGR